MRAYDEPLYYEIAFSFFDLEKQLDLFEKHIDEHSDIDVNSVLDIACGPSLQLREMSERGYRCVGLDNSKKMLDYLNARADEDDINIEAVQGDMVDFKLDEKVDFAFILMGTIGLMGSNDDLLSHLDSVADSLNEGGLYLIENLKLNWASDEFFGKSEWTEERDGIEVHTTYSFELKDELEQTAEERIILDVDDHDDKRTIIDERVEKIIFPQEFLTILQMNGRFEFLGWFERYEFEPLSEAKNDNLIVLRKR